jgi:hypothetical protein
VARNDAAYGCHVPRCGVRRVLWLDLGLGPEVVVPFGTLVALCGLWLGISVPLVFVGSYFGFKSAPFEEPMRTNKIPRQVRLIPPNSHAACCVQCVAMCRFCKNASLIRRFLPF